MGVCRRCSGTGLHNVPAWQFQELRRAGKVPSSCSFCKGTGAREPHRPYPSEPRGDTLLVPCVFIRRDGAVYKDELPAGAIPDLGEMLMLEFGRTSKAFVLSSAATSVHVFREWTPLRLVDSPEEDAGEDAARRSPR